MLDGNLAIDFYSPSTTEEYRPHPLEWDDLQPRTLRIPIGPREITISTTHPDLERLEWFENGRREFSRVAALPFDWDSYGAMPVDHSTLIRAFEVFGKIMVGRTRGPQIGATVGGGVSIEWHKSNMGLELRVDSPLHVYAYFYDDQTGEEWDDEVGEDLDLLIPYLDHLGV